MWTDKDYLVGRMDSESVDSSSQPVKASDVEHSAAAVSQQDDSAHQTPPVSYPSGISSWARSLKFPESLGAAQEASQNGNAGMSTFSRFTSGLGLRMPPMAPAPDENNEGRTATAQSGVFESFTKGLVDSSRTAVKAMQVKARHIVSQNKRRYQVAYHRIVFFDFLCDL
jgi:phosphatidylinositol-3,4,5-trisphosphate 3-phosphatase/dual-specificity protein phosphatase PTEN